MFHTCRRKTVFFLVCLLRRWRRLVCPSGDSESDCLRFPESLTYMNAFLTCACAHTSPETETGIYWCIFKILTWDFERGKFRTEKNSFFFQNSENSISTFSVSYCHVQVHSDAWLMRLCPRTWTKFRECVTVQFTVKPLGGYGCFLVWFQQVWLDFLEVHVRLHS